MSGELIATVAMAVDAPASENDWVHLLPAGTFSGRDGRGPYKLTSSQAVTEATRRYAGRRQMPIDYDHQIDNAEKNGRPAPAAGWIKALDARTDGLWGLVEWTARARAHLEAREYRYLSPVFQHKHDGTVTRVLRAALTNNPNLDEITALASMETSMNEKHLDELRLLLELPDEADEAAVVAKVRDALTARQSANPDPSRFVPIGDFERTVGELNRLNKGISLQSATAHVASQIEGGKLPPFLKDWGVALCTANKPAFDTFVDRTKGSLQKLFTPMVGSAPPGDQTASMLTEEEVAVASAMGLTEAEFLKGRATTQTART